MKGARGLESSEWIVRHDPGCIVLVAALAAMGCSPERQRLEPDSRVPAVESIPDAVSVDSACGRPDSAPRPDAHPGAIGECGECGAGEWVDGVCTYPPDLTTVDPLYGLPAVDVGQRQVFRPEDFPEYAGRPAAQIARAGAQAAKVGGAVILSQIYEISTTVFFYEGVLYTGGGLRRACQTATITAPSTANDTCITVDDASTFLGRGLKVFSGPGYGQRVGIIRDYTITGKEICVAEPIGFAIDAGWKISHSYMMAHASGGTYVDNVVIDSVYFDGGWKRPDGTPCNAATHDWREANMFPLKGRNNVIRNSVFTNTPSENLTICGAKVIGNVAYNLAGSFVHKSCSASEAEIDVLAHNYVENANMVGNELMEHSEGLITFSANSDPMALYDNVFRHGNEGVLGWANGDDGNLAAFGGCYAHFPRLLSWYGSERASSFKFIDVEMIDVGPVEEL